MVVKSHNGFVIFHSTAVTKQWTTEWSCSANNETFRT